MLSFRRKRLCQNCGISPSKDGSYCRNCSTVFRLNANSNLPIQEHSTELIESFYANIFPEEKIEFICSPSKKLIYRSMAGQMLSASFTIVGFYLTFVIGIPSDLYVIGTIITAFIFIILFLTEHKIFSKIKRNYIITNNRLVIVKGDKVLESIERSSITRAMVPNNKAMGYYQIKFLREERHQKRFFRKMSTMKDQNENPRKIKNNLNIGRHSNGELLNFKKSTNESFKRSHFDYMNWEDALNFVKKVNNETGKSN